MVFQAANLMPWRRVRDNITLGLEGIEVSDEVKRERVRWTLDLVGLGEYEDRWPYQLSGGQRQRIGIARGLAVDPDILLMDEPFGALDAITRTALQDELLRIWQETGKSILFVTHDIEEAVFLGDRVLLLGDTPAHIVNEYRIDIDRAGRRESDAFLREVARVRGGLEDAIKATKA
jgi:NitT/TauT family transport system ATP-binding protein